MAISNTLIAGLLGVLEGLTEFIPVSSTGHILLAGHFMGFDSPGGTFEVVIQLGAIFALLFVFTRRIYEVFRRAPHDPEARRLIAAVMLGFLPAAMIGVIAYPFIKGVLFETPMLIAIMLILGGIVLLFVDRMAPATPAHDRAEDIPLGKALAIGLCQCVAMIPGVSRSGATIVGALLMGTSKRAAAEFSFFLSMPTMLGAVTYDLWKSRDQLDFSAMTDIGVGFVAAFVSAALVANWLLNFVSKRGYAFFGWWRIVVGVLALAGLALV